MYISWQNIGAIIVTVGFVSTIMRCLVVKPLEVSIDAIGKSVNSQSTAIDKLSEAIEELKKVLNEDKISMTRLNCRVEHLEEEFRKHIGRLDEAD